MDVVRLETFLRTPCRKNTQELSTKLCFKKNGSPFWLIALEGKKVWLKVIPRWKDDSKWKKTDLRKIFQNIWKWKKWRFFLLDQNISKYIFLKLWTSLISNMYSDFSYISSIKSYSPSKWVHFACFCPFLPIFSRLWKTITLDGSKIWKIWIHIWNQRSSMFQKNIHSNILN